MSTEDPKSPKPPSTLDSLAAEAQKRAVEAAVHAAAEEAAAGMSAAGESLLDGLERAIFGEVGGADAALKREEGADPLARLRAQHAGAPTPAPTRPTRAEAEAKARAELERLKAAMGKKSP